MKCPNCNETLLMTERNHIEIDYCPSCRGVWLDKGELDKMLEYAEQNSSHRHPDEPGYGKPGKYDTEILNTTTINFIEKDPF
ncbi:MAG: zf-TFIIB domain-containing protein [Flavisolibacter sp.]|nr:zf-TFIIB domain-containing protein [Flavisolibacter sp.]